MKTALVIGGGAVGLAIAGEIAPLVDELYLIEKEKRFGEHASSRSSEVIHSGIYYKTESEKAIQCVAGNISLQYFLPRHGVPYKMCGKLVVAQQKYDEKLNNKEIEMLHFLLKRAEENGVPQVRLMDAEEVKKIEPNVRCIAAIYVPTSGVLDSAAYLHTLESIAAAKNTVLVTGTKVVAVEKKHEQFAVTTAVAGEVQEPILVDIIVNAAGVHADKVAKIIRPENEWVIQPIKGEAMYFRSNREELQTSMHIYPAPITYTLPDGSKGHTTGVHTTWKLDGKIAITPLYDTHPKHEEDYEITHSPKDFLEKVVGFFPNLKENDLRLSQAGIQPKVNEGDFILQPDKEYQNVYHCMGIDSPGLTASLAIGKKVRKWLLGKDI
ncbi:FAD-dependent oxidoreductase [Candidatus Woesearchaeota archaeon]|nr:FAD-dependent oxidoreductase [Candidatus Woesearchaeota archaeon]